METLAKNKIVRLIAILLVIYVAYLIFLKKDTSSTSDEEFENFNFHRRVKDHFKGKYGKGWRSEYRKWKDGDDTNW